MMLFDDEPSFFSFLEPIGDGPAYMPVASAPPPYLAPPSIQPISINTFDSPSYSPMVDDVMMPWDIPSFVPPVSPPAPELFFNPQVSPLDVINLSSSAAFVDATAAKYGVSWNPGQRERLIEALDTGAVASRADAETMLRTAWGGPVRGDSAAFVDATAAKYGVSWNPGQRERLIEALDTGAVASQADAEMMLRTAWGGPVRGDDLSLADLVGQIGGGGERSPSLAVVPLPQAVDPRPTFRSLTSLDSSTAFASSSRAPISPLLLIAAGVGAWLLLD